MAFERFQPLEFSSATGNLGRPDIVSAPWLRHSRGHQRRCNRYRLTANHPFGCADRSIQSPNAAITPANRRSWEFCPQQTVFGHCNHAGHFFLYYHRPL